MWKVDIFWLCVKGHNRSVVNYVSSVQNLNIRTVVCIANCTWLRGDGRKFRSRRSRHDIANGREVNCPCVEDEISVSIQIGRSGAQAKEVQLGREVQTE